jgi:chromosome segregation ATPase
MARSSSVTFEAVEHICFQLLSQGENPSFNLVYAELGNKGSSEVVQRYIDQWRRETGAAFFRQRSVPGIPADLVGAVDGFMTKVWTLSLQHADQLLASQRNELEQAREEVRAQLDAAHARIADLETQIQRDHQQIEALNRTIELRDLSLSELRAQAIEIQRMRDVQESRIKQLEEAAEARDQRYNAELERMNKVQQAAQERYNAALREEQERSVLDREQLLKQIEQSRQEKLAEITALRQQVSTREDREARQREQTEEAKAALREAISKGRQLETSLAAAEGRIERLQAQFKTASEAAHGKESAVAAAEARARVMEEGRLAEATRAQRAEAALNEALAELAQLRKQRI